MLLTGRGLLGGTSSSKKELELGLCLTSEVLEALVGIVGREDVEIGAGDWAT